jgi:hypothetical protein
MALVLGMRENYMIRTDVTRDRDIRKIPLPHPDKSDKLNTFNFNHLMLRHKLFTSPEAPGQQRQGYHAVPAAQITRRG